MSARIFVPNISTFAHFTGMQRRERGRAVRWSRLDIITCSQGVELRNLEVNCDRLLLELGGGGCTTKTQLAYEAW